MLMGKQHACRIAACLPIVRGKARQVIVSKPLRTTRDQDAGYVYLRELLAKGSRVASQKDQAFGFEVLHDLGSYGYLVICLSNELHVYGLAVLPHTNLNLLEDQLKEDVAVAANDHGDL